MRLVCRVRGLPDCCGQSQYTRRVWTSWDSWFSLKLGGHAARVGVQPKAAEVGHHASAEKRDVVLKRGALAEP